MNPDDTIVALATPAGRGGIGVVRLAGPDATKIALPLLRLKHELTPGRALFGDLVEPQGSGQGSGTGSGQAAMDVDALDRIDEVVVTYFQKPHSYTTDDIVEISAHGSPVVLRHIVERCLEGGARLAEPGEFTMRAFLNGRMDLTQAEAVRDLIDAQTLFQAKVAAQQLEGALSRRLKPIKQKLVELIARLEAGVDFAEDDVSVLPDAAILHDVAEVEQPLQALAASFAYGKLVHEGLTLAIVGRPNVGKSSLFNRLVESERAIVTAQPGTTRDLVSETVSLGGIPVKLVDTAGIRRALDEAESIGIRKSMEALADADLVLVVLDASEAMTAEDEELMRQAHGRPTIVVQNKCDLADVEKSEMNFSASAAGPEGQAVVRSPLRTPLRPPLPTGVPTDVRTGIPTEGPTEVRTSALSGEGIAELRDAILHHTGGEAARPESGFLTNVRHQRLVQDSLQALAAARGAVTSRVPHEMLLLDLYNALRPLDEITGATTQDDILALIFSTFCIGK